LLGLTWTTNFSPPDTVLKPKKVNPSPRFPHLQV
jgi:hypothetical protein